MMNHNERVSLAGRVAIVTGAGGGLGRAYARELAAAGAAVLVNDTGRSLDGTGDASSAAQAVVDEIRSSGGDAAASTISVSTPEGGEAIVQQAVDAFGRVDIVISNAGILRDRSIGKIDWEDFHAVHDVHLRGSAYLSQPAFRLMKAQGYGRFVFVGSNAGTFGNFGQAAYGSAKGGVVSFSGVLAIEGEKYGVLSNVICPMARTRMTEAILDDEFDLGPQHVAPLVVFLASEQCRVTHQVISAGGGSFARVVSGLTEGWVVPPGERASADEIARHIDAIVDVSSFEVPLSASDELALLRARLRPESA